MWSKLDDQYANHPKIVKVRPLAAWLNTVAIIYCSGYLTDGFVPEAVVSILANFKGIGILTGEGWKQVDVGDLVASLVKANLWTPCEGGYLIHDYLEYNPSAEEARRKREASGRRMEAWRGRQKTKPDEGEPAACNAVTYAPVTGVPSPSPSPSPITSSTNVEEAAPPTRLEDEPRPGRRGRTAGAAAKPRDPNLDHPAVVRYRDLAHVTPNQTQRAAVVRQVTDVDRWGACVEAWIMRGNKPTNVAGMLDWYRDSIPQYTRSNHAHGTSGTSNDARAGKGVAGRSEREDYDNAAALARI